MSEDETMTDTFEECSDDSSQIDIPDDLINLINEFSTLNDMNNSRQYIIDLTTKIIQKIIVNNHDYSKVLHLCDRLLDVDHKNSEKWNSILKKTQKLTTYTDRINDLDTSLHEYLHRTKKNNEIISDIDMQHRIKDIDENSLIIYIKKAQLYKVYNSDTLEDFQQDEGTHYRRPQYGPVYEVVRDEHPQKVVVIVADDIKDAKLKELKQHIVEFIKKDSSFANTTIDLKAYSNNNKTEFVISSLRLPNIEAKEKFIEAFIKFMTKKGKDDIADKIQIRIPESVELEHTRFYKLPTNKISLDGSNVHNLLDQLISTASSSQASVVINLNINSNNTNINNSNCNNSKVKRTETNPVAKRTLRSFYRHIYETRPEWYLEGKMVDLKVIEAAYREYFNDRSTSTAMISKHLKDKLFDYSKRSNNIFTKRLVLYKNLEKYL